LAGVAQCSALSIPVAHGASSSSPPKFIRSHLLALLGVPLLRPPESDPAEEPLDGASEPTPSQSSAALTLTPDGASGVWDDGRPDSEGPPYDVRLAVDWKDEMLLVWRTDFVGFRADSGDRDAPAGRAGQGFALSSVGEMAAYETLGETGRPPSSIESGRWGVE